MASFKQRYKHANLLEVRASIEEVKNNKKMYWLRSALALYWLRGIEREFVEEEKKRKGREHQDEEPPF